MKCPVCSVDVKRGEPGVVIVKVPVEGQLRDRPAHAKCIESVKKSHTTVNRP